MTNDELTEKQIKGLNITISLLKKKYPEILSIVSFELSNQSSLIFLTLEVDIYLVHSKYFNEKMGDFWTTRFKGETKKSFSIVTYFDKPNEEDHKTSIKVREKYENFLNDMYEMLPEDYQILYSGFLGEYYPRPFNILEFQFVI
jgi:hypothetical protein